VLRITALTWYQVARSVDVEVDGDACCSQVVYPQHRADAVAPKVIEDEDFEHWLVGLGHSGRIV
jgi:hypothetical protein